MLVTVGVIASYSNTENAIKVALDVMVLLILLDSLRWNSKPSSSIFFEELQIKTKRSVAPEVAQGT